MTARLTDAQQTERTRALVAFMNALWLALDRSPAGYPDATVDRNRFVGPIEAVISDIKKELRDGK